MAAFALISAAKQGTGASAPGALALTNLNNGAIALNSLIQGASYEVVLPVANTAFAVNYNSGTKKNHHHSSYQCKWRANHYSQCCSCRTWYANTWYFSSCTCGFWRWSSWCQSNNQLAVWIKWSSEFNRYPYRPIQHDR